MDHTRVRALHAATLPSGLAAHARLLLRRRPGLDDPAAMPALRQELAGVQLDPAWLQAYRRLVGLPDEAAAALPPLALQIAAAPLHLALLADRSFPFKALGLVHLGQRVEQFEAVAPARRLDLRAFTSGARWERRGMSFGLVTEAWADARCVWRGETTALARGPSPLAQDEAAHEALVAAAPAQARELARVALAEDLGRRYAAIAGDLNPIHQRAWLARRFGFERAIVHGTWTLARTLAAAAWPQTGAWALQARFRKPVLLPSTIRVWQCQAAAVGAPGSAPGPGPGAGTVLWVTDAGGERRHLEVTLAGGC